MIEQPAHDPEAPQRCEERDARAHRREDHREQHDGADGFVAPSLTDVLRQRIRACDGAVHRIVPALTARDGAGEAPDRLEILRRYLEHKGVDLNERDTMIDSLLDWVEPNAGLHRLNAPPERDDYHPPHTLLTRIDELKKVAGWAEFTSTPGWDDDFTLNSSGPVDVAWALM